MQKQNTVKNCPCSEICPILTYRPSLDFPFLQHLKVMEDMLKDFLLGEHLLLVGNQVGHLLYSLLSSTEYQFIILYRDFYWFGYACL